MRKTRIIKGESPRRFFVTRHFRDARKTSQIIARNVTEAQAKELCRNDGLVHDSYQEEQA